MSGQPLFVGFKLMNNSGQLIYGGVQAFDTSTSEMLWDFAGQTVQNAALTLTNGTLHISVYHPHMGGRSLVFVLRPTDGKQLADYDLPTPIAQWPTQAGSLYPLAYHTSSTLNLP